MDKEIEVETAEEQLAEWVKGNSLHGYQCCPDFSCCQDHFKAPRAVREKFAAANEADRMEFLKMFLAEAFAEAFAEKNVHIAGDEPGITN